MKYCKVCTQTKPIDAFWNDVCTPDGKWYYCKECENARKRRQYVPEKKRDYYENNLQKIKAKDAAYLKNNKEKISKRRKRFYDANKKRLSIRKQELRLKRLTHAQKIRKAYNLQYYARNKDEILLQVDAYRKAHPEVSRTIKARRKARLKNAHINDLSLAQVEEIKAVHNFTCVYCLQIFPAQELVMDHLTPLVHNGNNTVQNVLPACFTCNTRKHTGPILRPVQPLLLTESPPKPFKRRQ